MDGHIDKTSQVAENVKMLLNAGINIEDGADSPERLALQRCEDFSRRKGFATILWEGEDLGRTKLDEIGPKDEHPILLKTE